MSNRYITFDDSFLIAFSIRSFDTSLFIAMIFSIPSLIVKSHTLLTFIFNLLLSNVAFNFTHHRFCIFQSFQKIIAVSCIFEGAISWVVTASVLDDF
jgi:hypothetical protein